MYKLVKTVPLVCTYFVNAIYDLFSLKYYLGVPGLPWA